MLRIKAILSLGSYLALLVTHMMPNITGMQLGNASQCSTLPCREFVHAVPSIRGRGSSAKMLTHSRTQGSDLVKAAPSASSAPPDPEATFLGAQVCNGLGLPEVEDLGDLDADNGAQ